MTTRLEAYQEQLAREISATPEAYLPNLLQIVRAFRQSVAPGEVKPEVEWREFDEMLERVRRRFAEAPMADDEIMTEVEAARQVLYDSRRH